MTIQLLTCGSRIVLLLTVSFLRKIRNVFLTSGIKYFSEQIIIHHLAQKNVSKNLRTQHIVALKARMLSFPYCHKSKQSVLLLLLQRFTRINNFFRHGTISKQMETLPQCAFMTEPIAFTAKIFNLKKPNVILTLFLQTNRKPSVC